MVHITPAGLSVCCLTCLGSRLWRGSCHPLLLQSQVQLPQSVVQGPAAPELLGPVREGEQQTPSEDTVMARTSEEVVQPGPEHGRGVIPRTFLIQETLLLFIL